MGLKQRYETITNRIYQDYSLACKQLDEIICNPKGTYQNIKNSSRFKKDTVSTIASATIFNPLYAMIETTAGRLTDFESIKSRMLTTAFTYASIGLGMEGRERVRQKFGVTKDSPLGKKYYLT
ncbi:hypothetical protein KY348_06455 [Candidatus Woesearchaeota archaeon]|nr:hypothetical protein [Candidatus Woesearchaeota archaeon]